ncbi:hypothetical protein L1277_000869 [Okibacterium sp. HSC-33S16]|uniref:ScyD/ScyE family protein n=1 Tax=Okibacterium sp. HSC-33S16 TaxID=2910965 RepID=UPI00209E6CCD|nr:ScyD/ScyE family protein [Okibacterium sp. HSC-33S16]MCP2030805.1 hypothetical protein [Okibacterium sp. HSC-33S16]
MKKLAITAVTAAAVLVTAAVAAPASAAPAPPISISQSTLATGLFSPLSLAVDSGGVSYVTQNFIGVLTRVNPDKTTSTVASAPGEEISAVSTRNGTVYYAQLAQDHSNAFLMSVTGQGAPVQVADLWAHENTTNPDASNTYGFVGLPQSCLDQFDPASPIGPPVYTGIVDTHPYASVATAAGVYVADAGANAILRVGYDGSVTTTAVLPPTAPTTVTAAIATEFGFPACSVGSSYRFEGVPTDVEVGPDGWLYVTSLPGGPEDASLGMRGSVVKVNPSTGQLRTVATGFVGSTDLAVSQQTGAIFVTELFGGPRGTGQVSVVLPWGGKPVAALPVTSPATIELVGTSIYVTRDAFVPDEMGAPQPIGKLTKVTVSSPLLKKYLG